MNIYSSTVLDTKFGDVKVNYHEFVEGDCITLVFGDPEEEETTLVRIQSSCLFSESFHTQDCDCSKQLDKSFEVMSEQESGIIVYKYEEGRGVGLKNKIKSMEYERKNNTHTKEAFSELFRKMDYRNFDTPAYALKELGAEKIRLITNNPKKVEKMEENGIEVVERVDIDYETNDKIENYLNVKKEKLNHKID